MVSYDNQMAARRLTCNELGYDTVSQDLCYVECTFVMCKLLHIQLQCLYITQQRKLLLFLHLEVSDCSTLLVATLQ